MKPYYDSGGITIYLGDCREILPDLPKVDLVLTDPPYGFGLYPSDIKLDLSFLWGLNVKNKIIFGYPEIITELCMKIKDIPQHWLIWWPTNAGNKNVRGKHIQRETEHIAIWGTVEGYLRQPSSTKAINPLKWGHKLDRPISDVWRDASPGICFNAHLRLHPNEKPASLITKLLLLFPNTNLILDPFLGSGTTAYCAKKLNRKCIGIEINERYAEIAAKRCSQQVFDFQSPQ